jgi:uncharacterized protein YbjT (DUF2867 family)
VLILGGGCRGLRFAEETLREGHAVRIVTRTETRRAQIEAAGAECRIGDPNRLGTLRGALEGVAIACWLLSSATGSEEQLRALHGARLRAFLESAIDTTVRGFLYEAAGSSESAGSPVPDGWSVPAESPMLGGSSLPVTASLPATASVPATALVEGERIAREVTQRNSIPLALLHADPADVPRWVQSARAALASMLA